MNILILGDSFCHDDQGTWPNELRNLGHTVTCVGEVGCSNYVILENFRKHYNSTYDYVIVLLTSENRIPIVNGPSYLCNHIPGSPSWGVRKNLPHGFESAVEGWFNHMHNHNFLRWTVICGINEIESHILPHQTIIWIDALLSDSTIINEAKTKIKINGRLLSISTQELNRCGLDWDEYRKKTIELGIGRNLDLRKNHMIPKDQLILAEFVNDVIVKHCSNQPVNLDLLNSPEWATDHQDIYPYLFLKQ